MRRFLISFDDGSMDHITEQDMPAVGEAAHAVVRDAKAAGVWIFGAGVERQQAGIVAIDGSVADGSFPEQKAVIGGFCILETTSREDALIWAARSRTQLGAAFSSSSRAATPGSPTSPASST